MIQKKWNGALAVVLGVVVVGATLVSRTRADEANDLSTRKALQANYDKFSLQIMDPSLWKGDGKIKKITNSFNTIDSLSFGDKQATVDVVQVITMSLQDSTGQSHEMMNLSKTRDTWVKKAGGWDRSDSKRLWEADSMDGRKVRDSSQ